MKRETNIDADFFRQYAKSDAQRATQEWNQWLKTRRRRADADAMHRKAMEICSGLGDASIRHYLKGRHRYLGEQSVKLLDRVCKGLGIQPIPSGGSDSSRRRNRVALLTQLSVPSESYHMELIRGLVREGQLHDLIISLHEVTAGDLSSSIARIRKNFRPDAMIMLRLTPTPADLKILSERDTATILIHADRYAYPQPVLANIVPNHDQLQQDLDYWIHRSIPKISKRSKAIIVTMPRESGDERFGRIAKNIPPSIRNDRIDKIIKALNQFGTREEFVVEDYRFNRAIEVFQKYRDADLFISLSDQIAVGLKHLLIASNQQWTRRIIGFDNTPMSRQESLPSFSQSLETIGSKVIEKLNKFLNSPSENPIPSFEEIPVDVHLEMRYSAEK